MFSRQKRKGNSGSQKSQQKKQKVQKRDEEKELNADYFYELTLIPKEDLKTRLQEKIAKMEALEQLKKKCLNHHRNYAINCEIVKTAHKNEAMKTEKKGEVTVNVYKDLIESHETFNNLVDSFNETKNVFIEQRQNIQEMAKVYNQESKNADKQSELHKQKSEFYKIDDFECKSILFLLFFSSGRRC